MIRFGLGEPTRPATSASATRTAWPGWCVRWADETLKHRKGDAEEELHIQRLMPADALRVRGRHNAANALAALALATAIGCPLAPMLHGLREYAGEPHRVGLRGHGGRRRCLRRQQGHERRRHRRRARRLGADKAPAKLVVILGGDGKGQDFAPLAAPIARHAARRRHHRPRRGAHRAGAGRDDRLPLQRHDTLEAAVRWCFERARTPATPVLLSPACASLDMFRNYAHRAEVFVATVNALAAERGGRSAQRERRDAEGRQ